MWASQEYLRLPPYDHDTPHQPSQLFLCHQQNGRVCAGWCGTHDMEHSLAVRYAGTWESPETIQAILDYKTMVPLFASGQEACDHGMRDVRAPKSAAKKAIDLLNRKRILKKD